MVVTAMFSNCSPPSVNRIWLWVQYNKNPIYPIFYLLKGDYRPVIKSSAEAHSYGSRSAATQQLASLASRGYLFRFAVLVAACTIKNVGFNKVAISVGPHRALFAKPFNF